jgi:hypothetical protein
MSTKAMMTIAARADESRPTAPSPWISSFVIRHSSFFLAAACLVLSPCFSREWTDATSGRKMEADLLGIEQGKVVVTTAKHRYSLPLDRLSETDLDFLKGWMRGKSLGQMLPFPWWPEVVQQPEVKVKGGPQADGTFKFNSKHYEFHCDSEVSVSVMSDFATVAEGTIRLLYSLPIAFAPLEGRKFTARILASEANYRKAGGPDGSAGVFISGTMSGEGVLLVPFESLGIERFLGRNTKGYDYDATVLIHEMAHQVTAGLLPLMPRWLSEGLAEYAANMPYRNGVFQLGERERLLALRQRMEFYQQLSRKFGVNVGSSWMLKPSELITMPDTAWSTAVRSHEQQFMLHKLYLSSLFLMHYFLHYADNGDARRIRLYFHTLNDVATYIRTDGDHGAIPSALEDRRDLSLEEAREFFLRQLFAPQALTQLDREFHAKFTELGFRF